MRALKIILHDGRAVTATATMASTGRGELAVLRGPPATWPGSGRVVPGLLDGAGYSLAAGA